MDLRSKSLLVIVGRLLLVAAAATSSYLAWLAMSSGSPVAGCAEGAACDRVLSSQWSSILGLPVAVFGTLTYLFAAVLGPVGNRFRAAHLAALLVIPAAAAWFVGVQFFAIGSFCTLCCAAHLLATAGAATLLLASQVTFGRSWIGACGVATAAVAGLAAVQSLADPIAPQAGAVVKVFDLGERTPPSADFIHEFTMLGGRVSFDLEQMPLTGASQPQQVVVALTDYTCLHCRKLNDVLQDVGVALGGEVAILKLPATRKGTDSAEVHRQMLALWKVSPKMHWTLERALIEGRVRPTAESVREEAIRLVGSSRLAEANVRHRQWITDQIENTRRVQDANRQRTGKGTLPQVMVGSELVMGAHADPGLYLSLIEEQFGLVAQPRRESVPAKRAIAVKDGTVKLGEVSPGAVLPVEVVFANRSSEPMEISWLNMGTNVGLGSFTRGEIDPEDEAKLELKLTVPADARPGLLERTVSVNMSSGQGPLTFRLVARVGATVAQVRPAEPAE